MTLKECLNYICERQIPKEINGLRTKYVIEEYKIVLVLLVRRLQFYQPNVELIILV